MEDSRNRFTVCVKCMTYNHASFIVDAMNGFTMQQTNFPYVCVIVDDASTDGEPQIIRDYYYQFFNHKDSEVAFQKETEYGTILFAQHEENKNCFFAIVLLKENHHSQKRSKLPYCSRWSDSAEYIALCEGDDYWTDFNKLNKQFDHMQNHPNCTLCVHSAEWQTDECVYPGGCQEVESKDYAVEDLIYCGGLFFATASFFYRANLDAVWPKWRLLAKVGDFPLQILSGLRGNVHYLPDKMCVYRYQSGGSWTFNQQNRDSSVAFQKNKIQWMTLLNEETNHVYQKAVFDQLFQHFHSLYIHGEISLGDYLKATYRSRRRRFGRVLKDYLRVELSPIYHLLAQSKKFKK